MQQRLCLAHALVHDPQVLLLDEPASGLDPRARVELRELLRELRALGKTILISSHILPELEELCTSVAIVDRGQVLAQGRVADIERRLRFGAVLRVRVLGDGEAIEAARERFAAEPDVASATILEDGTIELGFRGDDAASAAPARRDDRRRHRRIASFARAASDLEELFLQVTAAGPRARGSGVRERSHAADVDDRAASTPRPARSPSPPIAARSVATAAAAADASAGAAGGIAAVGVKELRGRMRGRRAFVILTIYLLLLGGFAWMVELLDGALATRAGSGPRRRIASAPIGQGIFAALLMLETLLVVFLAPASTAGAISLEREKQTLDMLVATPISSLAIVVGKLLSALTYVFLLIIASDPADGDRLRLRRGRPGRRAARLLVLLVTAIGLGSFGLFMLGLVKRGRRRRPSSRSSASWPSRSARSSCWRSGPRWRTAATASGSRTGQGPRPGDRRAGSTRSSPRRT